MILIITPRKYVKTVKTCNEKEERQIIYFRIHYMLKLVFPHEHINFSQILLRERINLCLGRIGLSFKPCSFNEVSVHTVSVLISNVRCKPVALQHRIFEPLINLFLV
jgi:hypothetical protein